MALIAGVGTIDHRGDLRALVDDRHGMRHVDRVVAVAPRVERVAGAGDTADHAFSLGPSRGRKWRQVEVYGRPDVKNHFCKPARAGDDRDATAPRPARPPAD